MLVNPLPGTGRDHLRETLLRLTIDVGNLRSRSGDAAERLIQYLGWVTEAAGQLRGVLRPEDLTTLLFTPHYTALLNAAGGGLPERAGGRAVNGLLALELNERVAAFQQATDEVKQGIARWSAEAMFIVADTNFYLHHPTELGSIDFHRLVSESGAEPNANIHLAGYRLHLLIPSRVIYELDKAKLHNKDITRTRARRTLKTIDSWFEKPDRVYYEQSRQVSPSLFAHLSVELLIDPVGHAPLPVPDDEIVDRIQAVKPLMDRDITLITYDTNMSTKARIAGVPVIKLEHI